MIHAQIAPGPASCAARHAPNSQPEPMIEPAHVVGLPKGQCFALIEGGYLWKIRMPLPANDPDEVMPKDLQAIADGMRKGSDTDGDWWHAPGYEALSELLPDDLVDDFRQVANDGQAI